MLGGNSPARAPGTTETLYVAATVTGTIHGVCKGGLAGAVTGGDRPRAGIEMLGGAGAALTLQGLQSRHSVEDRCSQGFSVPTCGHRKISEDPEGAVRRQGTEKEGGMGVGGR